MNIYICTVKIVLYLLLIDWDVVSGERRKGSAIRNSNRYRKRIKTTTRHRYRRDSGYSSRDVAGLSTWKVALRSGTIYGSRDYVRRRRYRDNDAPGFCHNFYKSDENDTMYGVFTCPLLRQPDNYDWCCGEEGRQSCCAFMQDSGRMAGVIIGIIIGILVFIVIVLVVCMWITGWTHKELSKRIRSISHRCYRRARVAGGYEPTEDTVNIAYQNERYQAQLEPREPTIGDWDYKMSDASGNQDYCPDHDHTIDTQSGEKKHIAGDKNEISLESKQGHDADDDKFPLPDPSPVNGDYGMSSGHQPRNSTKENDLGDGDSPILKRHPPIRRLASDLSKSARYNPSADITLSYVPPAYDIATAADFGSVTNDLDKEAEVENVSYYDPELASKSVTGIETTV